MNIDEMWRSELIDWLVEWRQTMKGSISPYNHRKLLESRKTHELRRMVRQIVEVHEYFNSQGPKRTKTRSSHLGF